MRSHWANNILILITRLVILGTRSTAIVVVEPSLTYLLVMLQHGDRKHCLDKNNTGAVGAWHGSVRIGTTDHDVCENVCTYIHTP